MTPKEYGLLRAIDSEPVLVLVDMLSNREDRALIWGYTCDRDSFHAYLMGGEFHIYCYGFNNETIVFRSGPAFEPYEFVPNKRLYPEACDFEFCSLLKRFGQPMSFTTYNDKREPASYYGDVK